MQCMRSMFGVQNWLLDNARYPELHWTSAPVALAARW